MISLKKEITEQKKEQIQVLITEMERIYHSGEWSRERIKYHEGKKNSEGYLRVLKRDYKNAVEEPINRIKHLINCIKSSVMYEEKELKEHLGIEYELFTPPQYRNTK